MWRSSSRPALPCQRVAVPADIDSLVPQRLDRIQRRRFPRRVPAEAGADQRADDEPREGPAPREDHRDVEPERDAVAAEDADDDANEAADLGEDHRLEEELPHD